MCLVAGGSLDAMITLREVRSVDVAAAQLIVTEAGGTVALPGGDALDLEDALARVARGRARGTRLSARQHLLRGCAWASGRAARLLVTAVRPDGQAGSTR